MENMTVDIVIIDIYYIYTYLLNIYWIKKNYVYYL